MMSYLMGVLVVASFLFSIFLGRSGELSAAALSSGIEAIRLCVELVGTVALWSGIMNIAKRSGLCEVISRLLSPVTGFLFKGLRELSPQALDAISLNITANLLGLGSAATPMGLEAMAELDRLNGSSSGASDYMTVFVALNTASFQILPTTVATFRSIAGSAAPLDILPAVLVSSAVSVAAAVSTAMLLTRSGRRSA